MGENNVSQELHKTVANESFWEIKLTIDPCDVGSLFIVWADLAALTQMNQ